MSDESEEHSLIVSDTPTPRKPVYHSKKANASNLSTQNTVSNATNTNTQNPPTNSRFDRKDKSALRSGSRFSIM